MIIFGY